MDELKKQLDAVRQVNAMCMKFMKEIQTEQNLAEMMGLGKDVGTDVAIVHILQEIKELKEENANLIHKWSNHKSKIKRRAR